MCLCACGRGGGGEDMGVKGEHILVFCFCTVILFVCPRPLCLSFFSSACFSVLSTFSLVDITKWLTRADMSLSKNINNS